MTTTNQLAAGYHRKRPLYQNPPTNQYGWFHGKSRHDAENFHEAATTG